MWGCERWNGKAEGTTASPTPAAMDPSPPPPPRKQTIKATEAHGHHPAPNTAFLPCQTPPHSLSPQKHHPGETHSSVPLCPEDTKQIKPCRPQSPPFLPTPDKTHPCSPSETHRAEGFPSPLLPYCGYFPPPSVLIFSPQWDGEGVGVQGEPGGSAPHHFPARRIVLCWINPSEARGGLCCQAGKPPPPPSEHLHLSLDTYSYNWA